MRLDALLFAVLEVAPPGDRERGIAIKLRE
jgi:hypothetical protein